MSLKDRCFGGSYISSLPPVERIIFSPSCLVRGHGLTRLRGSGSTEIDVLEGVDEECQGQAFAMPCVGAAAPRWTFWRDLDLVSPSC
jgi:hypothetical protein